MEFMYHWSPIYPRRRVHLSENGKHALCGRYVGDIEVENVGPLQPFVAQGTTGSGIYNLLSICVQCYVHAYKILVEV